MTLVAPQRSTRFNAMLAQGQVGESRIACWMRKRQWAVMPVYDVEVETGKGPRLFAPSGPLIAPDMFAFKMDDTKTAYWVEAKHKTRFSWYGIKERWVTGIDQRHYEDYCRVDAETPWPVWLMFLHTVSETWPADIAKWGAPTECPVGLFGGPLKQLRECESHRSDKHGRSGMVYWAHKSLKQLATLDEV